MSPRSVDPNELERHPETDGAGEELERYARRTAAHPPHDFADRVMAAVEREPAPRRTLGAWLAALASGRGPANRWAQVAVLSATLVLAVGGVLAAGELGRLIRDGNVGTPASPSIVESASPTPSVTPTPSAVEPSATPTAPAEPSEAAETPEASEAPQSQGPAPTASEDHESTSDTPDPTETPRASDDHSGSD
jgi:hypothetical protein